MKRNSFLLIALIVFITSPVCWGQNWSTQSARPKRDARIAAAVRVVLNAQRDAWNRSDVEGYMDGYARSERTLLISGDSLTRGWQTVHDRYKRNYNSREKMGTLTFSGLDITVLSNDAAVIFGRWHLQRANDEPQGRFTLIFRRMKEGWRIVHDHTSSAAQ